MTRLAPVLFLLSIPLAMHACLWDSDTLAQEKAKSPKMAEAVLGNPPKLGDPTELRQRITVLEANRKESDPAWWNELAAAHIRLGAPKVAVDLLEPVVTRFPNDYGIHANLGTAYHLLGRYQEAEKEIARDLELNPEAHFGLEKYHLALLQYLTQDAAYQKSHVYVDEYSKAFLNDEWGDSGLMAFYHKRVDGSANKAPAYREKWDLASDTNRENGVLYMASLNPREPACFVMLGIDCLAMDHKSRNLNLAIAAFEKAIALGSPQKDVLQQRIDKIRVHLRIARTNKNLPIVILVVLVMLVTLFLFGVRFVLKCCRHPAVPS